jgi:dynactin 1
MLEMSLRTHIGTEMKESQLREASRKIGDLEEAILDYDQTIGQFRELATQLTR